MLIIRREQERALARAGIERYERRALEHLQTYFSDASASLGEEGALAAVRHGLERALGYGLETERDLLRYLTLTFVFGRDFDADPALPWAAETLRAPLDGAEKTGRLQAQALRHRARTAAGREGT